MLFKKLKQAWSNWLNRMASQNKASFGSETLDCCRTIKAAVLCGNFVS